MSAERERVCVTVCADDYALSPAVSKGIRQLLRAGRVSATSAMATRPAFREEGPKLGEFEGRADLGLHFTLTDHAPLTPMPTLAPQGKFPSCPELMKAAYLRKLPLDEIAAELEAQLDLFTEVVGRPPDHVDGHHHVQQLPGIRDVVLDLFPRRLDPDTTFLRVCAESLGGIMKRPARSKALVLALAGTRLRSLARRKGVKMNAGFSGAYDFEDAPPYGELFNGFLAGAGNGLLVMCHPGYCDAELESCECLTSRREDELAFLAGPEMPVALEKAGVGLCRFSGLPVPFAQ